MDIFLVYELNPFEEYDDKHLCSQLNIFLEQGTRPLIAASYDDACQMAQFYYEVERQEEQANLLDDHEAGDEVDINLNETLWPKTLTWCRDAKEDGIHLPGDFDQIFCMARPKLVAYAAWGHGRMTVITRHELGSDLEHSRLTHSSLVTGLSMENTEEPGA